MFTSLSEMLERIAPADRRLAPAAQARLDDLTKPQGSLGRLEETALRLCLIQGGAHAPAVDPALMVVVAGDHGVTEEGVSLFPQEVTRQMLANILDGGAAISVLARQAGMDMLVVDAGCAGEPVQRPGLDALRLGPSTGNIAREPAMSRELCERALLHGANRPFAQRRDWRSLAIGEMGIGNSTPATALYCAYLGLEPEAVAGPGAGLAAEGVRHKAAVVRRALERHAAVARPDSGRPADPVAVLAALGGFEIAVMAGVVLGAAARRLPVIIDGFISTSAYVAARAIHPAVADYAFLAHASAEPGYAAVIRALHQPGQPDQAPLLHLNMRLGEGTGCALALPLLRAAAAVYADMATFSGAGVSRA